VSSTVFLISPARCDGERAAVLATSERSELGVRLRDGGAPIGEVFAWLSALYFRGKVTYAQAFARPPARVPGVLVMAAGLGLVEPHRRIGPGELHAMGQVEIESDAFTGPLRRDAEVIAGATGDASVVLLGSIASGKYVDTLLAVFGARLVFPETFVGRGDMSRGGLLLRAAKSGEELAYVPVQGAVVRGKRPPKLPRIRR
jgi:hypothetical protein